MGDMKYVAGVDIGNATTEVALAKIDGQDIEFLTSGIGPTTGIKGTLQNISGVFMSLKNALEKAWITVIWQRFVLMRLRQLSVM